jgi:hypothetical protein
MSGTPEQGTDDLYCRSFNRIKQSFGLKNDVCPLSPTCEKRLRSCVIVADLIAECEGSRLGTPEDVEQELILQGLEAEASKH